MTTNELIEKYGIGHNCLSDAYDLGRADMLKEVIAIVESIKKNKMALERKLFK